MVSLPCNVRGSFLYIEIWFSSHSTPRYPYPLFPYMGLTELGPAERSALVDTRQEVIRKDVTGKECVLSEGVSGTSPCVVEAARCGVSFLIYLWGCFLYVQISGTLPPLMTCSNFTEPGYGQWWTE